jgi:hypothetical protein
MKKYTDLIQMLEKIFGKGAVSRTIGTRTNVVRFPKGKQPIDPTRGEFDVEGTAAKNPDLVQTIENSIEDRMGDITKMNDQELLTYTSNVRRLVNFKEPPVQNADVVKFGSGEEIKGKGLEQLIEKQGTKNPPTTVAGRLEAQGKKLEKAGEDLKEITEPKSVIGDIIKDYGDFDKYMQSSQKTGYVRATVRQIMREDIQAGKLKLPKELQDQVMQGIGEPIDIYRKVYGEGALEQIDSLADDLGQFRTEEEAAKFARSKYTFEPKVEPVDESMTYDELGNLIKKGTDEPEGKADGGIIGRRGMFLGGFLSRLINSNPQIISAIKEQQPTSDIPLTLQERYRKYLSESENTPTNNSSPIGGLIGKLLKGSGIAVPQGGSTSTNDFLYNLYKKNLEGKADGGRIGYAKGKRVKSQIDKLLENLNKKTKGKKSMESVDPKTGEVTVPKKPIRRAEEPTGTTVMDPEPETIDERAIPKKEYLKSKTLQELQKEYKKVLARYEGAMGVLDPNTKDFEGFKKEVQRLSKIGNDIKAEYQTKKTVMEKTPLSDFEQIQANYRRAANAAEEIFPDYGDPKMAASQLAEVMADQKYEAYNKGFYDLPQKIQNELYNEAYNYVTSVNRLNKIPPANKLLPPGTEFNISDDKTAEAFTNFARENDPEGFKKIQKIVDDINNKNTLEEFDIKDREPNANGGIAGLL